MNDIPIVQVACVLCRASASIAGRCHIILSSLSHMQAVVIPGPKGGEPNSYNKEGRRAYSKTKQGPPIPYEGLGLLLLKPYNYRNY